MTARRLRTLAGIAMLGMSTIGGPMACRPSAPACPTCAAHEAEVARWREDRLAGLRGELTIEVRDGKHFYDLQYTLPSAVP